MGNDFLPLDPPRDAILDGGSGGHKPPTPQLVQMPDTSHLFDPYSKYIPQAMNTAGQIHDPNAILQAYQQHLPEFQLASNANPTPPPVSSSLSSKQQGK